MKFYECDICNFSSNNKSNYTKHLHTQNHIDNITPNGKFCCNICLKIFNHYSSLCTHKKSCSKKIQSNKLEYVDKIDHNDTIENNDSTIIENLLLKQKVKFLEEKAELESKSIKEKAELESRLIREKEEKIELESKLIKSVLESKLIKEKAELESKLTKQKSEIESKLIKEKTENKLLHEQSKKEKRLFKEHKKELLKSKDEQIDLVQHNNIESARHAYSEGKMNALTFVSLCYNKTSKMPLIPMDSDYVVADVKSDKDIKFWIEQRPEFADEYIAERLLHIYDSKGFTNYITNIVVKAYKKDDPAEQTFWASDVSRLIYIVRSTIDKKNEWVYDKKGVIIKESIIDPLLDEVYKIIIKYKKYMENRYLHSVIKEESDYYMKKLSILKIADKLIDDFRNRQAVKNQIIRVLAPKFFLDRDANKDKNKIQDINKQTQKQKQIEYQLPKIEEMTIFDKIKKKKLEESKQISEDSENTEDFLNDPRVKFKMGKEKELINSKKIDNSSESEKKPKVNQPKTKLNKNKKN